MRSLLVLLLVFLGGCSVLTPPPHRDNIVTTIELVESFPGEPRKLAETRWHPSSPGVCQIKIRRDVYPNCVTHEIMHCFSEQWHEGEETDKFCYVK